MATQSWGFTTDTGLTYDPLLIQVAGGVADLVGGWPADLLIYMTLNTALAPDFDVSDAVGAPFNGAAITAVGPRLGAGCLDCRGNAYVQYTGTQVAACGDTGTYAMWLKPDYNGAPVGNDYRIWVHQKAPGDGTNRIDFWHDVGTGGLWVGFFDAFDIWRGDHNFGVWNPVAGTWYHVEVDSNVNPAVGKTRLFIDGVQLGIAAPHNFVRTADNQILQLSGELDGTEQWDGYYDDLRIWDTILHVANFAPPVVELAGAYSATSPSIVFAPFQPIAFNSFAADVTAPAGTSIGFALRARGWQFWFNGHFWDWRPQTTATATESCTLAEITANFRYLKPYSATQLVTYFISDGTGTPQLDNVTIDYDQGLG